MWKSYITSLILVLGLFSACTSSELQTERPPVSPLIPNQVPIMLENQWRLIEVVYESIDQDFDAIEPVLATFHPGLFAFQACNSIGFLVDTENVANRESYKLIRGDGTARQCDDGGTEQEGILEQALLATNHYEIINDKLILEGENVRLVFFIDNETKKPADWQ